MAAAASTRRSLQPRRCCRTTRSASPTVEINNTFYRMPNEKILAGWSAATPERFKLTLKAPKRITHDARLKDCADRLQYFLEIAATLGPKLGALLFQLPPSFKQDLAVLDAFLESFPAGYRRRLRVSSRFLARRRTLRRLEARNLALCVADSETFSTPVRDHGGLRLLPLARRRLQAGRHRALGADHPRQDWPAAGKCSCTSSTKKRARVRSSPASCSTR